MKLILIRSPQLLFYKMKSKKEDKNMMTDTTTMSNGRIQYERKAAGKFYKMKSKNKDKNMTTDTITISYNYSVKWKDTIRNKSCRKVNT